MLSGFSSAPKGDIRTAKVIPAVYHPMAALKADAATYYPDPDLKQEMIRTTCGAVESILADTQTFVIDLTLKSRSGLDTRIDPFTIGLVDPEGKRHLPVAIANASVKKFEGKLDLSRPTMIYLGFRDVPVVPDGEYHVTIGTQKPTDVFAFHLSETRQYDREALLNACATNGSLPESPKNHRLK
jgi:hypothetical protein